MHAGLGAQPLSEPTIEVQGARRSSLHRASEAQSTHGCPCGFELGQGHKAPLLPRYPRLPALPSSRMGCPGGAHSPSSSGGGKAGGWPKELGDKAGAWRHAGAHIGTTGSVGQAESTAGAGGHGDDRGTWAVDHLSAWTQTLRHNPGVCTPEMGSHQINAGWAEPGSKGTRRVFGDQPSSPGQDSKALPSPPITLPRPHHSAATSGVQVRAGQKMSWIHNTPTLPGSTRQRGGPASVARHDCPARGQWGQGLASGKSRGSALHKSLINNMCYQFPLRLQNAGAGGRGLLTAPGAVGWPGHRSSLLLGAAPCPLPPPSLHWEIGTTHPKHLGPSVWQDSLSQAGHAGESGPARCCSPSPLVAPLVQAPIAPAACSDHAKDIPCLALQPGAGCAGRLWEALTGRGPAQAAPLCGMQSAGLGQGNGVFHCLGGPGDQQDHWGPRLPPLGSLSDLLVCPGGRADAAPVPSTHQTHEAPQHQAQCFSPHCAGCSGLSLTHQADSRALLHPRVNWELPPWLG